MKIIGEPVAVGQHGEFLATFDDPSNPTSYVKGLMWVGRREDGGIAWTEGVRKAESGLVDIVGMTDEMRALWAATCEGRAGQGLALPQLDWDPS